MDLASPLARTMIRCDSSVAEPPAIRCDESTLRKSRRLDDGSWRYEAVVARADVSMVYAHGQEQADEAALSDPDYLDSFRGLSVVAGHPDPKHQQRVDIGRPGTYVEVGTVLGARWDAAERATVLELVVRNPDANAAIKAGKTGVSEGYTVSRLDSSTSPARQMGRRTNHVALTLDLPPRMAGAHIRADTRKDTRMDPEVLAALCAGYGLRTDSAANLRADLDALQAHKATADAERTRADALDARLSLVAPLLAELGVDATRTDALDAPKLIAGKVAETVGLMRRADSLGVKVDGEPSANELRTLMAVALGGDATRCDADPSYCDGVIAAAKPLTSASKARVTVVTPAATALTPSNC